MEKIKNNIIIDTSGCWIWQKSCSSSGYGQFTIDGVYWNTHRYVWQKYNGDIRENDVIRHTCHNKACCNISHLMIGTHKDNYADSVDIHKNADACRRLEWIVNGITYGTSREVVKNTGLSTNSVIKYTNKTTRVFDIISYRASCLVSNKEPKI